MGASDFCGLMHVLAVLAPGVDAKRFPTVASYGRFGAALLTNAPDTQPENEEDKEERGWQVSPPKGKRSKVGRCTPSCGS